MPTRVSDCCSASKVAGPRPEVEYAILVVKPFGWKGHQPTLRDMAEESLHLHQGLLSSRIQFAIRDGALDPAPYGQGTWDDPDQDGVSLEIESGMLTTVVTYLAQLEAPTVRPPRDPALLDMWAAGRTYFDQVGCASCHVPTLELKDSKLDARVPPVELWSRTGRTFKAYENSLARAGAVDICRFFNTSFAPKSSHFYAPHGLGGEDTIAHFPDWQLEDADPMVVLWYRLIDQSTAAEISGSTL